MKKVFYKIYTYPEFDTDYDEFFPYSELEYGAPVVRLVLEEDLERELDFKILLNSLSGDDELEPIRFWC